MPFFKVVFLRIFLAAVLIGAVAAPCAADAAAPADGKKPFYMSVESLPPSLLLPPPAEGSAAWDAQIDAVITAQQHLSKAELSAARDEQHMRLELITGVIGDDFTRERKPKTFAMLDHVLADSSAIVQNDKKFWHIRRPYLADRRVKLLIDPINENAAYPSGHTAESRVLAEVLGMLYPDKLKALRARADTIARHRIDAGVHSPADIEAGRSLAMLIVGALTQSDDFQDELLVARQEIQ